MRWATLELIALIAISLGMLLLLLALLLVVPRPSVVKVDCSLASFHPDYTPAMRKACQDRHKAKSQ